MKRPSSKVRTHVWSVSQDSVRSRVDQLAAEEPLEVRLMLAGRTQTVAITMRTPGNDFELAVGFLYGEGVIRRRDDISRITYCVDPELDAEQQYNIVSVHLRGSYEPDLRSLERHFYTSSACGVCGKASLEALKIRSHPEVSRDVFIEGKVIASLTETLRASQKLFAKTGGLHAAALFSLEGELIELREDVGRHNAVDKLIGWALLDNKLPLRQHILLVSGRSSFEIMQKALVAGVPMVCAVSAPSSLAVALAKEFGLTLIGFLRDGRFNIYANAERIRH